MHKSGVGAGGSLASLSPAVRKGRSAAVRRDRYLISQRGGGVPQVRGSKSLTSQREEVSATSREKRTVSRESEGGVPPQSARQGAGAPLSQMGRDPAGPGSGRGGVGGGGGRRRPRAGRHSPGAGCLRGPRAAGPRCGKCRDLASGRLPPGVLAPPPGNTLPAASALRLRAGRRVGCWEL